jgi:hypothetical protein
LDCLQFYKNKLGSLVYSLLASLIDLLGAHVLAGRKWENLKTLATDKIARNSLSPRQYLEVGTNMKPTSTREYTCTVICLPGQFVQNIFSL